MAPLSGGVFVPDADRRGDSCHDQGTANELKKPYARGNETSDRCQCSATGGRLRPPATHVKAQQAQPGRPRERIEAGVPARQIAQSRAPANAEFVERRERFLLY